MAAMAGIASRDGVACLAASTAGLLDLLHHAGSQGPHDDMHAGAMAHLALVLAPRLGACAFAGLALDATSQ